METAATKQNYFLKNARNFCAARLLELDRDLYRATLYAGRDTAGLQALFLLMAEVEAIPALVTEPLMGAVRIKWWYDSLSAAHHDGRTLLLAALMREFDEKNLQRDGAQTLLETMQDELAPVRFQSAADWTSYHRRKAAALARAMRSALSDDKVSDDRYVSHLAPFLALRTLKSMAKSGAVLSRACPRDLPQPDKGRLPEQTARILTLAGQNSPAPRAPAVHPAQKRDDVAAITPNSSQNAPGDTLHTAASAMPPLLRHIAAFNIITARRLARCEYDITRPGFVRMGGGDLLRLWWKS